VSAPYWRVLVRERTMLYTAPFWERPVCVRAETLREAHAFLTGLGMIPVPDNALGSAPPLSDYRIADTSAQYMEHYI
jgi:hypothetical protein